MSISKKTRNILIICAAAVAALACGAGVYINHEKSSTVYLRGTTMNGEDVAGRTPQSVAQEIRDAYQDAVIEVTENGQVSLSGTLGDFGYTLREDELQAALERDLESEKTAGTILKSLFGGKTALQSGTTYDFDDSKFADKVSVDNLSVSRVQTKDAYLTYDSDSGELVVVPEVYGNEISDADLRAYVKEQTDGIASGRGVEESEDSEAASTGVSTSGSTERAAETEPSDSMFSAVVSIPSDLYPQPSVTKDSEALASEKDALEKYKTATVTYDFGDDKVTYDFGTIIGWFDQEDGNVSLDQDKVAQFVSELADKYDTRSKERTFKTTYGNTITFSAGRNEYGYTIDQDAETSQLIDDVQSAQPVEREPVYITKNSYGNPYFYKRTADDDMAGTYVEVNLSAQHMWYYEDGELKLDSSVVSGDTTKGHGTATGVFPLAYKESPSVLTGGNGNGAYTTKVQYWMPFYEGQGLHDASWRNSFGGSIYRGNGSHGCVNLPPSVAASLYSMIEPGTAIVIYY